MCAKFQTFFDPPVFAAIVFCSILLRCLSSFGVSQISTSVCKIVCKCLVSTSVCKCTAFSHILASTILRWILLTKMRKSYV